MQARSLDECLTADDKLARLASHAARLLRLRRVFAANVPPALARGARIANFRLGSLIVHADNSAVAAKLRQLAPTLLEALRKEGAELTGMQVEVQVSAAKKPLAKVETIVPLGAHAKQGLTSLAGTLPNDSPLRHALQHLVAQS